MTLAACAALAPVRLDDDLADKNALIPIVLPNGLKTFISVDQRQPIASVSLVLSAGSVEDPPGKDGLAHLVQHLAFRSRSTQSLGSVRARWDSIGATPQAETAFDHTRFGAFAPRAFWRENLAVALSIVSDPLAGIDDATFGRELEVVRNELWEGTQTHGGNQGLNELQKAIFPPGDPYQRSIVGTPATLATLTLADARAFASQYYRPSNCTLLVDGDLPPDARKTIAAALQSSLGARAASSASPQRAAASSVASTSATFHIGRMSARVASPELWLGWVLPSIFDPNGAIVLPVVSQIQSDVHGDRFRDDDEEIADVSIYVVKGRRGTLLACHATLAPSADPERAAGVILDHVTSLAGFYLPTKASARAPRGVLHNLALFMDDDPRERIGSWATAAHFTGDPRYVRRRLSQLLVDNDPLAIGDFLRERLSAERARGVFLTPTNGALPIVGRTADNAAPVPDVLGATKPFPETTEALATETNGARPRIETRTLPNGLSAIVASHPSFRGATVLLGFHGGSSTEQPPGVVEVVDVAGVYSTSDMACAWDHCGVLVRGGWFTADITSTSFRSDSDLVPHALELASQGQDVDWVRWPNDLPARQYRAYRRIHDVRVDVVSLRTLEEGLFPNHRWGRTATIDDLERIGSDVALTWSRRHQAARNAAVVVVGNVDPGATLDRIAAGFKGWRAGSVSGTEAAPAIAVHENPMLTVAAWPGAPQAQVAFGCRLPAPTVDDVAWQDVFTEVLDRHLERTLREFFAATYGFSWSRVEQRGGGSVVRAHGLVSNPSLRAALAEFKSVLATLRDGKWPIDTAGADGQEAGPAFDAERWSYLTKRSLAIGTREGLAWELLHEWNMDWPVDGGVRILAGLSRVDTARMAALARSCHDSAVVSIAGEPAVTSAAIAGTLR